MEGIDRRMLLGATGATMLLAACDKKDEPVEAMFAPCLDYGDSPRKKDGKKPPANVNWRPEHYCVVFIKMDDSKLVVKHAYYATGLTVDLDDRDNPSDKKSKALNALSEMSKTGQWPGTPKIQRDYFEYFWFGSQQEIYIFVDGTLAKADPDRLIVFTEQKTKPTDPVDPQKNKTFYNAQALAGELNGKDVIFMQNWFLNRKGDAKIKKNPTTDPNARPDDVYAMNIHILLGAAGIPGVIDPNTGNGAGNEP